MNLNYFLKITNKNLKFIILLIISSLIILSFYDSLSFRIKIADGYALGDWLINFEDGGFKRRGLSGTLFLALSRLSGIYVGDLVLSFVIACYILFFVLLSYLLSKVKFSFYNILLIIQPTIFLLVLNDKYVVGRKEILLFIVFLTYLILYIKQRKLTWGNTILTSSLLLITMFFHEIAIFYTPYFLILPINDFINEKLPIEKKKIGVILVSVFIPMLLFTFFGSEINCGNTKNILLNHGVNARVMDGVLNWPKISLFDFDTNVVNFSIKHNYFLYLTPIILSYFIIYTTYKNSISIEKQIRKRLFLKIILFLLFFSSFLFYVAPDWGRWVNIHLIMSSLTLFYFSIRFPIKTNNEKFSFLKLIYLLVCIILCFFTTMKHVDSGYNLQKNGTYYFLKSIIHKFTL